MTEAAPKLLCINGHHLHLQFYFVIFFFFNFLYFFLAQFKKNTQILAKNTNDIQCRQRQETQWAYLKPSPK